MILIGTVRAKDGKSPPTGMGSQTSNLGEFSTPPSLKGGGPIFDKSHLAFSFFDTFLRAKFFTHNMRDFV